MPWREEIGACSELSLGKLDDDPNSACPTPSKLSRSKIDRMIKLRQKLGTELTDYRNGFKKDTSFRHG
jgi:hypothetical protein